MGDALDYASINENQGVVQAIIECGRADEISLKPFSNALYWSAENREYSYQNKSKCKALFIDFTQFNKTSPEDLGKALQEATSKITEQIKFKRL